MSVGFCFLILSSSDSLEEDWCCTMACAGDPGTYLAAFTGDAAVVVSRGFVPTHYTQLILV